MGGVGSGVALSQEKLDKVRELGALRWSQSRIARELGLKPQTVGRYLNPRLREGSRARIRQWMKSPAGKENRRLRRLNLVCTVVDGKHTYLKVKKRPRPEVCEICGGLPSSGNRRKVLDWHHWNSDDPRLGIWVCFYCHRFCEAVEKRGLGSGSFDKYLELKKKVKEGIDDQDGN